MKDKIFLFRVWSVEWIKFNLCLNKTATWHFGKKGYIRAQLMTVHSFKKCNRFASRASIIQRDELTILSIMRLVMVYSTCFTYITHLSFLKIININYSVCKQSFSVYASLFWGAFLY